MARHRWISLLIFLSLTCLGVIGGLLVFRWSPADKAAPPPARRSLAYPLAITQPAAGVILVASRRMLDHRFRHAVILLLAHDDEGTVGLIINRPTDLSLADALPELSEQGAGHRLFFGGPVALNTLMFLVRNPVPLAQATRVLDDIYVSSDRGTLEQLLGKRTAVVMRLYFGYAGWGPGQLNAELANGSWQLFQTDADTLFQDQGDTLWEKFIGPSNRIMARHPTGNGCRRCFRVGPAVAVRPLGGVSTEG
ncbi:MAG: YqgE/AlgH family protein [Candidatus Competibacteraceae bacterium]